MITGCCWNKFSEFKSTGILGFRATHRRGSEGSRKNQEDNRKAGGSVWQVLLVHQSTLIAFHLSWVKLVDTYFLFSLGRDRDRSCPVSTVHHVNSFHTQFCSSTHHDVLECHPSRSSWLQKLLLQLSKSFIWVLHAELIAELLRLSQSSFHFLLLSSFDSVLCDVGYFFVAQSHSVDVSRWSALIISSHSRIVFMSFFWSHCVFFFE